MALATADKNESTHLPSQYSLVEPHTLTVSVYANFFPVAYRQGDGFKGLEVSITMCRVSSLL